jgi:hypothetical protein
LAFEEKGWLVMRRGWCCDADNWSVIKICYVRAALFVVLGSNFIFVCRSNRFQMRPLLFRMACDRQAKIRGQISPAPPQTIRMLVSKHEI